MYTMTVRLTRGSRSDRLYELKQGEFVGLSVESQKTKVRGTVKVDPNERLLAVEPFVEGVTEKLLEQNYERIYSEVEAIITGEIMPAALK
ncbi:hypothetical protein [Parapedobacter tibetensis]|uniref:hypothetical protein n=2 Tax=Parapedobacter tibetensis TaxID=2972951 RepID=UPI002153118C|nr:hypothetical protein [Parapedobacter tibetensis]